MIIDAAFVITTAFTDKNILTGKIKDEFIEVALYEYVRPVLGDDLYAAVIAAPTSSRFTSIIANIKTAAAFFTKYVALPDMAFTATNTGIQIQQFSTAVPASDKQIGTLREQARQNGDTYMKKVVDYIKDHREDFTEYTCKKRTKVRGGILL